MSRIYLDHNATSPLRPEARAAMLAVAGNPSSVHAEGRAAKAALEDARGTIARAVGAAPRNVTFTSGATEAANLALTPAVQRGRDDAPLDLLLIGAGEHAAVRRGHRFAPGAMQEIALTSDGALSLPALDAALAAAKDRRIALALQAVNNETGVIQPLAEAAERVHAAGGVVICDATQAVGRMETGFAATGVDILFFSSHKLGGPMGAGALVFARDDLHISDMLIRGGGQEYGRRAGTENLPAIAGFAAALKRAIDAQGAEARRLSELRGRIECRVRAVAPEAVIFGAGAARAPNASCFAIPGISARTLVMALDLEGVAVSSGSACSSGKMLESYVLAAMGGGAGSGEKSAVRASLGWSSRPDDVEQFGTLLAKVVDQMRSRRRAHEAAS